MFGRYLRRELGNRRRQTVIIAIGMALAVALVIVVNAVSAGVKDAQAQALASVYGVGTDITVTSTPQRPDGTTGQGGPQQFDFGAQDGSTSTDGETQEVNQSRLEVARGSGTLTAANLATVAKTDGVASATGVLSLTNSTFSGTLPTFTQGQDGTQGGFAGPGQSSDSGSTDSAPTGGADGAGGSSFGIESFTVLGVDPTADAVGPLSAVTLSDGVGLDKSDVGKDVAVLDSSYATTEDLAVGDTITLADTDFEIVGIVASTDSSSETAANVYIPLDVAQTLSGEEDALTSIYVSADSADDIDAVQTALEKKLENTTVSTQADLASTVSGSLSSAGSLVANLGTWLSILVLAAAFLIAILFTISGVTRRTREFGTLKAIGWSNRRIVGQVAGESLVQGLIGGAVGAVVGLAGVLIVNLVAPTLSASVGSTGGRMGGGTDAAAGAAPTAAASAAAGDGTGQAAGGFGGGGPGFGGGASTSSTTDIALHAPITLWIIAAAVGLALLGGLLAGAIGGWRASRLRPAEALRSVA
ncbi:ABC transporter permease [Schumannella sp. 10F1B-5-1]|uniref:ABC transporter permease n=1 Tax=Schumannella sp. 10F1B-5-1 TaxID=2590780 RepID=UPI00113089EA|nr:ABC transporter permease [Schumannella sp. 10F1B-5-1]TPW72960.1 ABC transporter permease [Schumannella sp. 10F1B-5-1]